MTDFRQLPDLPDGIYFDLPQDIYHALPRIGSGGLCSLLVSPATFWASSWLNEKEATKRAARAFAEAKTNEPFYGYAMELAAAFPQAEEPGADEDESLALTLGRAYHCARLEPDQLDKRFVRQIAKEDFDEEIERQGGNVCWNGTAIADALAALGQPKTKAGESVVEKAVRLEQAGYAGVIWPLEQARFEQQLAGRTPIRADLWDDMIEDAERLRQSKEVAELLTGGFAEVTVLYTGRGGVGRKVRFDYLARTHWLDFKTFANPVGKNLYQLLTETFRYQRHYIQAIAYREAAELLRVNSLQIMGPATDEQRRLVAELAVIPDELACWYVYQEKSGVPNILARRVRFFDVPAGVQAQNAMMAAAGTERERIAAVEDSTRTESLFHQRGKMEIGKALRDFELHMEIYPAGAPWLPVNSVGEISDADLPGWWLDGKDMGQ